MTLQEIHGESSVSISTIIAASKKSGEDKEAEKSPQVPDPSEGTYQPADDPDDDKQKEAEEAPPMPQPPTP
ncbi:hypothetical protein [Methylophaga sp.]|uniref:hypothetical protein n=1 Tax=Methylophaga sp. TaxID=2024840 RepID=UPI0025F0CEAC|nr:hypothetical protein [Methylophaga sp.]